MDVARTDLSVDSGLSLERKKRSRLRVWVITASVFILVVIVACVGVSVYVGYSLTHPARKPIELSPSNYGIAYKNIQFKSSADGVKLSGWVLLPKKPANMTLIFAHGYRGNRYEQNIPFFPLANQMLQKGYRIIMFDFRDSGSSGGNMTTVGAKEQYDLLGAIHYTKQHYKEPIGLYGISMGASASLLAAAKSKDVIAVVADSPYSDLESYLKKNLPVWTHLPNFPFTPLIMNIIPRITDLNPKEASPISVLNNVAPRPVLFIHSTKDGAIPYTESVKMAKTHPNDFSLWLTKGDGHVKSYEKTPTEYVKKIDAFYKKALKGVH
jgi:uncharacterized protein